MNGGTGKRSMSASQGGCFETLRQTRQSPLSVGRATRTRKEDARATSRRGNYETPELGAETRRSSTIRGEAGMEQPVDRVDGGCVVGGVSRMTDRSKDKVACVRRRNCGWRGTRGELLRAAHPFDPDDECMGCPECFDIDSYEEVCDEPGCWETVTCGTPTSQGYRSTCHAHAPPPFASR